jgi:non-canonical purine NTP pyrophosphatase (RdgB/HAM1 family)
MLLVSGNQNKRLELERLLSVDLEISQIEVDEIQATDVQRVVEAKAKEAYRVLGRPVLVDDSSLSINAWNGLPGALVKWFISTVGLEGLVKMLEGFEDRSAYIETALCLCSKGELHCFRGRLDGEIALMARGEAGFGYDAIFIPRGHRKTIAEMSPEEKDQVSPRAQAARALLASSSL